MRIWSYSSFSTLLLIGFFSSPAASATFLSCPVNVYIPKEPVSQATESYILDEGSGTLSWYSPSDGSLKAIDGCSISAAAVVCDGRQDIKINRSTGSFYAETKDENGRVFVMREGQCDPVDDPRKSKKF